MKASDIINLTPHTIKLNCGIEFESNNEYQPIRVGEVYTDDDSIIIEDFEFDMYIVSPMPITDLPPRVSGRLYIVSAMVQQALIDNNIVRHDIIAPATGHKDCVRNDKGQIVSVPGFVRRIK